MQQKLSLRRNLGEKKDLPEHCALYLKEINHGGWGGVTQQNNGSKILISVTAETEVKTISILPTYVSVR